MILYEYIILYIIFYEYILSNIFLWILGLGVDLEIQLQCDKLYMAVCFWFLVKSDQSSVCVYCSVHWTIHFLHGNRKTQLCLAGRVVVHDVPNVALVGQIFLLQKWTLESLFLPDLLEARRSIFRRGEQRASPPPKYAPGPRGEEGQANNGQGGGVGKVSNGVGVFLFWPGNVHIYFFLNILPEKA